MGAYFCRRECGVLHVLGIDKYVLTCLSLIARAVLKEHCVLLVRSGRDER
jgi:hypothetical protein